jgi:hypothetical protein
MTTKDLEAAYKDAEAKAFKVQTDRDEAITKVRAKYDDRLRKANNETAQAQKAWLDAQAADALLDRPDGEEVARALGLELPG